MVQGAISRRSFLRIGTGGVVGAAGMLLAACGSSAPSAPPAPISTPATSGAASNAPAATIAPAPATAAPAGAASTAAPGVTPAGNGAAALAPGLGKSLVGQIEGPTIITDPAQYPKEFHEAPTLADQVKVGKFPAVKDRLPVEPIVLKPAHEIGKYGGMWRLYFTGPGDYWNGLRTASGPDRLFFWDVTGNQVIPNIAKGFDVADGGKTYTVHLRQGLKWSDGQPFNADDLMFWFNDINNNKDLMPTPIPEMTINGKPGKMEKVDDYTVNFVFPDPYYLLPSVLAAAGGLGGGDSYAGRNLNAGPFAPAHYLKQFHPTYAGADKVNQMAKDAKFDSWTNFFTFKNTWGLNADLPTLSPWMTTHVYNTSNWTLDRNPYSAWVDTDGNQLPY